MLDMKEGIYFHEKKGFAIVSLGDDKRMWVVDKNIKKRHPFLRGTVNVVEELSGDYFFNKSLKGYEYISELPDMEIK